MLVQPPCLALIMVQVLFSRKKKQTRKREHDKKNRARRRAAAERHGTDVKTTQTQIAQAEKAQLQKIPDKHLSEKLIKRLSPDMIKQRIKLSKLTRLLLRLWHQK